MIVGVNNTDFKIVNSENIGLAGQFSVNPSSCENSDFYKDYLMFNALLDVRSGRSTTHLFIDTDARRIMGFISLRASSIIYHDEKNTPIGEPALEIAVLAVDKDYERRGVGSALIDLAISEASMLRQNHLGVRYITLAADNLAVEFYRKMLFSPMEDLWEHYMPKDGQNNTCVPMVLRLDFEFEGIERYLDEDDDEDNECSLIPS